MSAQQIKIFEEFFQREKDNNREMSKIVMHMNSAVASGKPVQAVVTKLKNEYLERNGKLKGRKLHLIIETFLLMQKKECDIELRRAFLGNNYPIANIAIQAKLQKIILIDKPTKVRLTYYLSMMCKICTECVQCCGWNKLIKKKTLQTPAVRLEYDCVVMPEESFWFFVSSICELCMVNKLFHIK
ncbi:PlxyGVORF97-like protein [Hyphantria cunea granulovirus]|uniref:PlxyGVORF97-like protein n=1 Tax=Hyphantria cunea granulovirus TaxID=307448 RepID=A0AAE6D0K8_9BBAC|nr:PlxyGVORF97-like protein [Hyphantria cunea granulovirus]QBQ01654.1 PlxyGVORF97-like protein [Hyphantria cunea granulovirus]